MHGKILVIDPIATNRIVLRVKLAASHYEMAQAESIGDAMRAISTNLPDMILCADTLPDGGPLRLTKRLQKAGLMGKVPILVIGAVGSVQDRLALFNAGVEDVLQKPIDDRLLLARTRSVMRAYASASEWKLRDGTSRALGFAEPSAAFGPTETVCIITEDPTGTEAWSKSLAARTKVALSACTPANSVHADSTGKVPDAFVMLVEPGGNTNTLELLATIRSHATTRHSSILVVQKETDPRLGAQMLDMGANDLTSMESDPAELALRLDALMKRKRMSDALRDTMRSGVEAAVIDPLTGLHNRRYAMPHLARIADRAEQTRKPFAVMVADMDYFKRINDSLGHAAGDAVLVETAHRLRENLRAIDLVARIGGEEFLIVLPGAGLVNAKKAAQRLCKIIRNTPFEIPGQSVPITATISIGMTVCDPSKTTSQIVPPSAEALLARADKALYGAKAKGRDRVTLLRPAA
ncbi:MAG: diguanylate cyclase [Tateyamaria sp.]|uniref:diguanylate cyclase n=1 Tax=Tateyamaria sp. TaxID=1929288 RepID=UPI00329DAEFF